MVLGFPIARVEISKEKSVVYHPEYKGVRLDIYARMKNRHAIMLRCRRQAHRI